VTGATFAVNYIDQSGNINDICVPLLLSMKVVKQMVTLTVIFSKPIRRYLNVLVLMKPFLRPGTGLRVRRI
jgi:hypothetical protein